jgi:nicotinate-nucleotide adenylyltransferase
MLSGMRGILGGTFDPPHVAHLVAAEAAYRQLDLDVVAFIPAGAPWQKASVAVSDAKHRWEMTELAIEGVDYFEADDREVRRDGWTYTVDTLETFTEREEILLVLGADAALGLPTWHRHEEVLDRATIAVVPRPGVSRAEVDEVLGMSVVWLDMPALDVSGTMLRDRVREGKCIRFLVSDPVWAYVREEGLYQRAGRVNP